GDLWRRQAKMVIEIDRGCRGTEAVNSKAKAMETGVALPADRRARLDRDPEDLTVGDGGQDILAIIVGLEVEHLGAGHRDDVGAYRVPLEARRDVERDFHLGASGNEDHPPRGRGSLEAIAAPRGEILAGLFGTNRAQVLARQSDEARPVIG